MRAGATEKLRSDGIETPVIILTGHGDVPMAVRAVQTGAVDFIEKPFREQVLLDRIQQALLQEPRRDRRRSRGYGIAPSHARAL